MGHFSYFWDQTKVFLSHTLTHTHTHKQRVREASMRVMTRLHAPLPCAWGTWWSHADGNWYLGRVKTQSNVRKHNMGIGRYLLVIGGWNTRSNEGVELRLWPLTSFLSAFDVSLLYLYIFFLSFCVVGSCCVGLVGKSLPCPFLSFSFLNSVVVLLYKIFLLFLFYLSLSRIKFGFPLVHVFL